jgi:RHS repeat-associated protein
MNKLSAFLVCLALSCVGRSASAQQQPLAFQPPPDPILALGVGDSPVDTFIGESTQDIPIEVPGYHGIEPKLSFHYESQRGNGFLGVGWSINGLSTIERMSPGRGAPAYTASDVFVLDGQVLVPCAAGSTSPSCTTCPAGGQCFSTQIESYERIAYDTSNEWWTIWDKRGTQSVYVPVWWSNSNVYRYELSRVQDTRGNAVSYSWSCQPSADCYIEAITYDGTAINFLPQTWRPDPISFANGQFLGTMNYLLSTVEVQVSGSMARTYSLKYGSSSSSARSLLGSIQKCGKDSVVSNGVVTMGTCEPASTYAYTTAPQTLTPTAGVTLGGWANTTVWLSGDVNGDGKSDLVAVWNDGGTAIGTLYLSNGSTYPASTSNTNLGPWSAAPNLQFFLSDATGDGKSDIVAVSESASGQTTTQIYMSQATTFAGLPATTGGGWSSNNLDLMGDVDGDGKSDLVVVWNNGGTAYAAIRLSNGTALLQSGNSALGVWATAPSAQFFLADANGDGKRDVVEVSYDATQPSASLATQAFLSTGASFTAQAITHPGGWQAGESWLFGDVNGDGAADLVTIWNNGNTAYAATMLSDGSTFQPGPSAIAGPTGGWSSSEFWFLADYNGDGRGDLMGVYGQGSTAFAVTCSSSGQSFLCNSPLNMGQWAAPPSMFWLASDVNGNGLSDLVCLWGYGNTAYLWTASLGTTVPDLLSSTSNGYGGGITFGYTPSSAYANTNMPFVVQAVSSITATDGRGDSAVTYVAYGAGLYDAPHRRFLGFGSVIRRLPCNAGESVCPATTESYAQDYASASKPVSISRLSSANVYLTTELFYYNTGETSSTYTSTLSQHWLETYDGTGNYTCPGPACRRTADFYSNDAYGNVTQIEHVGDWDADGDISLTVLGYSYNTGAYIVGLEGYRDVYSGTPGGSAGPASAWTLMSARQEVYDGAGSYATLPTVGNLTRRLDQQLSTGAMLTTSFGYDAYGNVTSVTDPTGATTRTRYDTTYDLYPVATTNALGQSTSAAWDALCGLQTTSVGLNGASQTTTTTLDALCRPTYVAEPLGAFTQITYCNSPGGSGCGTPGTQYTRVQTPNPWSMTDGTTGNQWTVTYFDGFGRTWLEQSRGAAGGSICQWTNYLGRGEVGTQSDQYACGVATQPSMTYAYDALDRPIKTTNYNGTTRTASYGLWSMTTTDELGNQQVSALTANASGMARTTSYFVDGAWNNTTVQFDVLRRISGIRDAAGNAWSYGYDMLGRRVSSSDPDLGHWTFSYDGDGRLVSQLDAKGQSTTYTYDALGRRTSKTLLAGTGSATATTWRYDEPASGSYGMYYDANPPAGGYANVGHLTSMTDGTGSANYRYDPLGHRLVYRKTVAGVAYTFDYWHDAAGRTWQTQYPDGEWARSEYDGAGRPTELDVSWANDWVATATGATYSAWGGLQGLNLANGVNTALGYDAEHSTTAIVSTYGARTLQSLGYSRDPGERVTAVTSPFPYEGWRYTYDTLSELLTATNTSHAEYNQTFSYNAIGNMTYNSALGTYSYPAAGSPHPHAVATITNGASVDTYSYDANGNQTCCGSGRSLVWDGANRPSQILSFGAWNDYTYDGNDERVTKIDGEGNLTVYVAPDYSVKNGVVTKLLRLGSKVVAKRENGTTFWIHQDALGSTNVVTNASGVEVQRYVTTPYGNRITSDVASPANGSGADEETGFIGERDDAETGYIYLHARYYDPARGRFVSADPTLPWIPGVGLNRYAYAFASPENLADPSGLWSLGSLLGKGVGSLSTASPAAGDAASPDSTVGAHMIAAATGLVTDTAAVGIEAMMGPEGMTVSQAAAALGFANANAAAEASGQGNTPAALSANVAFASKSLLGDLLGALLGGFVGAVYPAKPTNMDELDPNNLTQANADQNNRNLVAQGMQYNSSFHDDDNGPGRDAPDGPGVAPGSANPNDPRGSSEGMGGNVASGPAPTGAEGASGNGGNSGSTSGDW